MKRQTGLSAFALALTFASPAFAHGGHGDVAGFASGLAHPLLGPDHLLAMVAVGLWAGLVGGRSLWVWPASFVVAMLLGGMVGMGGLALPAVELVVLGSVVALGLAVSLDLRPHVALGAIVVAAFGLAHGQAHGMEAPADVSGLTYAAGFVLATIGLHGTGLILACAIRTRYATTLARLLGGAVALAGLGLIAG